MLLSKPLILLITCFVLTACGFQPLYGSKGSEDIISDFSDIQVAPSKDRIGQLLTNELRHLLNPQRNPLKPKYRLTTTLNDTSYSLAVKKTASATRTNLNVQSNYQLYSTINGSVLNSGSNSIIVSYNIYSSDYATLAAEKDAQNRAVKELAQEIRLQLGAYFKSQIPASAQ